MSYAWTENDTEKLIMLYGQYQCLWNSFHPEFNNQLSRYKSYKEIKNTMSISGLKICDCIKRIQNVKKEYCYELSKITAAIFCEKLYTPKAKWFKEMHMLLFPYTLMPDYANNFKKLDNNQKFNDSNILHLSFEKSTDKQICSNDVCGTCEPQEIELCLRLRESVHSAPKLRDAFVSSETTRTNDVGTGTTSDIIAKHETQMDKLHERRCVTYANEGKQDRSTCMDDISIEAHGRRRTEDNLDIFGKSVAFQMRTIDTRIAMELETEIQNLITKARLKTLESTLTDRSSTSICCCDCAECKVTCQDETCGCGLTLKDCLLLTTIKEGKDYGFCYN